MRSLYPDHTCQFFTFIGAACVCFALLMRRSKALLLLGAAFLGLAALVRHDMIPICLLLIVLASGLAFSRQALDRRYLAQGVIIALIVAMAIPGSALLWQVRSSGEAAFTRPDIDSNPGVIFAGYSKWLRSWVVFGRSEHDRFAWSIGSGSWPGFDIGQYPDRAFSGDDQRNRVSSLLNSWRDREYSDQMDEQFSLLAAENCADFVGRCHIALPFARMAVLWINLDGAHAFIAPLGIQRPLSTVLVFLTLCVRLMILSFATYAAWRLVGGGIVKDIRHTLIAIGISVVILRTIEIAVLGTSNSGISWGGLVEARYMTPVFPFLIGTAVLGLSLFLDGARSNVEERA